LSEYVWNKPVVSIFRERNVNPEVDPFVVIKARKLTTTRQQDGKCTGKIEDFFTLMGDLDYLSSAEGTNDHYVMCWFDDAEPDMTKDLRRMRGVTFEGKVTYVVSNTGKRTYNAAFKAEHAKLT
jgi:hypothetical protein